MENVIEVNVRVVELTGVEPASTEYQSDALPLSYSPIAALPGLCDHTEKPLLPEESL
jgi:hypothetical protein